MDIYVARQPIFDKKRNVFAYELLFRGSMENYMPNVDGDAATSSVLTSAFLNLGLDSLSGGKNVFINFTRNLIVKLIPTMFPKKDTIVEILENIVPDDEIMEACRTLKKKGYTLALDDYVFDSSMNELLPLADIVKVDFMGMSLDDIKAKVRDLPKKLRLLAEKIETWDEFRSAVDMGFTLFQGYFFCKPEVVRGREVPASSLNLLEIMKEINTRDLDFEIVTSKVVKDVSITYKLLRYINSAYFKRVQEITSIKKALIFLGQEELRRFMSVILMSNLAASTTPELAIASCVRGRFFELMGEMDGRKGTHQDLFTLGLFSLIDAILDQPMDKIMKNLPLSDSISEALVHKKGELSDYLELVQSIEKGDWEKMDIMAQKMNIDTTMIPSLYREAVSWSDAIRGL